MNRPTETEVQDALTSYAKWAFRLIKMMWVNDKAKLFNPRYWPNYLEAISNLAKHSST